MHRTCVFLVFLYLSGSISAFTTDTLSDGTVVGCFNNANEGCQAGGGTLSDNPPPKYTLQQCAALQCPGSTPNCLFLWDSVGQSCSSLTCVFSTSAQVNCNSAGNSATGSYFIVSAPTTSPGISLLEEGIHSWKE